jgi:hypothetical protein
MHGGVQFNCPAMHGGRAQRTSFFKKNSNPGQIQNMFQIWTKNKKKIPHVISARDLLDLLKSMYPDYPFITK